jgi:hypothetical protein
VLTLVYPTRALVFCPVAPEFDVAFLGSPPQQVERGIGGDLVDHHQHALGLLDRGSALGELGDGGAELVLLGVL